MNYKWLLLLPGAICVQAQAQAFQPSISIIEQFDGIRVVAFVNENDIKNYPLWHPLKEKPPLSTSEAINAAINTSKENKDGVITATVKEIELREIPHHKDSWHYLVKLKTTDNKYQVYVVLMNGNVIPAAIEPESYK